MILRSVVSAAGTTLEMITSEMIPNRMAGKERRREEVDTVHIRLGWGREDFVERSNRPKLVAVLPTSTVSKHFWERSRVERSRVDLKGGARRLAIWKSPPRNQTIPSQIQEGPDVVSEVFHRPPTL